MIALITLFFVTAAGIYTFSYGVYLAKKEKNALAAFGAILLALTAIAATALTFLLKY